MVSLSTERNFCNDGLNKFAFAPESISTSRPASPLSPLTTIEQLPTSMSKPQSSCFSWLKVYFLPSEGSSRWFSLQAALLLLFGQLIALLNSGTGVTSQALASDYDVNIPTAQTFLNYALLAIVYMPIMLCLRTFKQVNARLLTECPQDSTELPSNPTIFTVSESCRLLSGEENGFQEPEDDSPHMKQEEASLSNFFRSTVWKYMVIALVDVEANFVIVLAYQYTNLTSIQLLDSFTIPSVMVLSRVWLKHTFRTGQYAGAALCIVGIAIIVIDSFFETEQGGSNQALGDGLCLLASLLYATSNVAQEYMLQDRPSVEFLACIGCFGAIINGIQL
eukprot:gene10069-2239_t